jgi:hypothetical protein
LLLHKACQDTAMQDRHCFGRTADCSALRTLPFNTTSRFGTSCRQVSGSRCAAAAKPSDNEPKIFTRKPRNKNLYSDVLSGQKEVEVRYNCPTTHLWKHSRERIYSSYSFTTSALDADEWSASRPGRALSPGKDPRYPLYRRLGTPQSRSGHRG